MAWVKIDDAMPTHPKVNAAGPLAFALDVAGMAFSNRWRRDGFISDADLPACLPCLPRPAKQAERLGAVGRWHRDDDRGGWVIHDIHDYQPTAEEDEEKKRKRAEAGSKGGSKPKAKPQAKPKQNASKTEANEEAKSNPVPEPLPVTPESLNIAHTDLAIATTGDGGPESNSDFTPRERHRLAHVLQGKPDPRCELCREATG